MKDLLFSLFSGIKCGKPMKCARTLNNTTTYDESRKTSYDLIGSWLCSTSL